MGAVCRARQLAMFVLTWAKAARHDIARIAIFIFSFGYCLIEKLNLELKYVVSYVNGSVIIVM